MEITREGLKVILTFAPEDIPPGVLAEQYLDILVAGMMVTMRTQPWALVDTEKLGDLIIDSPEIRNVKERWEMP